MRAHLGVTSNLDAVDWSPFSLNRGFARVNGVIPKGFPRSVGRVESRLLGFPCFPYSVISVACFGSAFHNVTITAKARFENRNHLSEMATVQKCGSLSNVSGRIGDYASLDLKEPYERVAMFARGKVRGFVGGVEIRLLCRSK